MADLNSISRDICKNKNFDRNLSSYINNMMTLYGRFSYIKLSMNYYTFCDIISETEYPAAGDITKFLGIINEVIRDNIINQNSKNSDIKEAMDKVFDVRNRVTDIMEIVTAYVDRFAIYEHILNRKEFQFSEDKLDEEYYNDTFVNDILNYILSDRDNAVINSKIGSVVCQLPMRLTRSKFFELVRDAFNLYNNKEKSSFDDFIYMLNTVSGIHKPDGFGLLFPELSDMLIWLSECDYKNMDRESFDSAHKRIVYAEDFLSKVSDLYVRLMEIINDVYIILLASPYAFYDSDEINNSIFILKDVMDTADFSEIQDDITDRFIKLEGRQERIYEQISANDYVIDEISGSFDDEIAKAGLTDACDSIRRIAKLASGSNFVKLDDTADAKTMEIQDIDMAFDRYYAVMSDVFGHGPQVYNRAVMSLVLSSLPVFFNNVDEILAYIKSSLSLCSDEGEKKACVSLMRMLMEK